MSSQQNYAAIPDWARLRARYLAFWRGEVADECIIAHIQNPNPHQPEPEPWMQEASEKKYLDPEMFFALQTWRRMAWNWHADLFKYRIASYGPNVLAGFVGGRPVFGENTVWHEPVINSLDEADRLHFDEDNPYWRKHLETVDFYREKLAGVEQFGMTDFGGPGDWISTLMPTENFLIATIEEPDRMRNFALRLARESNRAYDILYPRITRRNDGIVNWMPVWSNQRMGTVQDDMAINFSPGLYAEVFLPALREMAGHAEHTVLHWHDGCSQHLDTLLDVNAITLIQYGHDPNSPAFTRKISEMQRIQAAGKKLFISCVEAHDVATFIRALDPRGLMMIINTASDEASRQMRDDVGRWTKERMSVLGIH